MTFVVLVIVLGENATSIDEHAQTKRNVFFLGGGHPTGRCHFFTEKVEMYKPDCGEREMGMHCIDLNYV